MRLLEGAVEPLEDSRLDDLTEEVRELRRELSQAKAETALAKRDAGRALSALRKQLGPLYQALRMVFGELDAAGVDDGVSDAESQSADPRVAAVWASWKSRMGSAAKIIDALLLHREMNTQQLAIATGLHRTTIPALIHKLNKAGLLNKNGGRFSLKQL